MKEYDEVLENETKKITTDDYYKMTDTIDEYKDFLEELYNIICDKESYPNMNSLQVHIAEMIENARDKL